VIARAIAGIFAAALVAFLAYRARSLARSGAIAAVVIGSLAVAVSWSWGALIVAYFVMTSAMSRVGGDDKRRAASIVDKTGPRDAAQVLANGGVFAIAALGMLVRPNEAWLALAIGALAASAADTWATEIGTAVGGEPRSILTLRRVPPGTSGGVSAAGTTAALGGAIAVALVALMLRTPVQTCIAAALGGFAAAIIDSVIGATLQAQRWCNRCGIATERAVHVCGEPTRIAGGLHWMNNDAVNFLSGLAGGLLAVAWPG
jgi:uncharacterized protein (TIGR00297 family)